MPPPDFSDDDEQLLAAWIRRRDQGAFRALAEKYARLVYGAALRKTGRADWSEEITQEVFIVFARRSAGLRGSGGLAGWLHRTAVFTAATRLRAELRRDARMKKLASLAADNDPGLPSGAVSGEDWAALRPVLDDAIAALPPADRRVVLLHYFEQRTFAEVAALEGLTRETAKKRGLRALEKLALLLRRRGTSLPVSAVCGGLTTAFSEAAPAALAAKVAAAGLTVTAATVVPLTAYFTGSLMTIKTSAIAASLIVCTAGLTWVAWPGQEEKSTAVRAGEGGVAFSQPSFAASPDRKRHPGLERVNSSFAGKASGENSVTAMREAGIQRAILTPVPSATGFPAPPPSNDARSSVPPEEEIYKEAFMNHPRTKVAEIRINSLIKGVKKIQNLKYNDPYQSAVSRWNEALKQSKAPLIGEKEKAAAQVKVEELELQVKEMEKAGADFRSEWESWLQAEATLTRKSILEEIKQNDGTIPPQPETRPPVPDAGVIDPHFGQAANLMAGENYSGAYTAFNALAENSAGNIRDQANWNAMLCAMITGNNEAVTAASRQLLSGTSSTACFAMAANAIQQNAWDEAQIWVDQAAESGDPVENAAMGGVLVRLGWMEEGVNRLIPPGE